MKQQNWRDPEISQRAWDGLWMVWLWRIRPEDRDALRGQPQERSWQLAGVFGNKAKAQWWLERRAQIRRMA